MNTVLNVYKPIGKTPLEMIQTVKKQFPEFAAEPISYAGRLDPLAHGVLLLMVGEAVKEREKYLALPKEYEFEVVFGLETDSFDVLGLLKNTKLKPLTTNSKSFVNLFVNSRLGKQTLTYPPFSSKPVNGKPLFQWAKEGKLSEITLPTREVTIENFTVLSFGSISQEDLSQKVFAHIDAVTGAFRQKEINTQWQKLFASKHTDFQTAKFYIKCSSGTYIRGIVDELGKELGSGAIAMDILRTSVGEYEVASSVKMS